MSKVTLPKRPDVWQRRHTRHALNLGGVKIGGGAPITVQTMTNTDSCDVQATVEQIRAVATAGCDIVRLAIPSKEAAEALIEIRKQVPEIPLIADIHFNYQLALLSMDAGVDGVRINPGNIGGEDRVRAVVKKAKACGVPLRIGVNGGSIDEDLRELHGGATAEALVESALRQVRLLESMDFHAIKISVKASDVVRTVESYRLLASKTAYPIHLGVTEAGTFLAGTVRSSVAMGMLLAEGIGDTIRVSLTDNPVQEVRVGLELLRCMNLREPGVNVTSCPTCGRTQVDVIKAANDVEEALEKLYQQNPAAPHPHVAVMGCVVNGPGEAREADLALCGGKGFFDLYARGEKVARYQAADAVDALLEAVRNWVD